MVHTRPLSPNSLNPDELYDCLVIGGGQAGLACGYYLNKAHLTFAILDDKDEVDGKPCARFNRE